MASRILWFLAAGLALVAGMVLQDGDRLFFWAADDRAVDVAIDRVVDGSAIDSRIDRAVDRSFDRMQIVGSDGREIAVAPETKRALGDAVGRLVKAKTEEAMLKLRNGSAEDIAAAQGRSDRARADVERLKAAIDRQEQLSTSDRDAVREQIQREIREDIRSTIRSAVRG